MTHGSSSRYGRAALVAALRRAHTHSGGDMAAIIPVHRLDSMPLAELRDIGDQVRRHLSSSSSSMDGPGRNMRITADFAAE